MTASHAAEPILTVLRTAGMGHEDPFRLRRLNARCPFSYRTFVGTHGNGRDALQAAIHWTFGRVARLAAKGAPGQLTKQASLSLAESPGSSAASASSQSRKRPIFATFAIALG